VTSLRDQVLGYNLGYDEPIGYDDPVAYSPPGVSETTIAVYDALGPAMRTGDEAPLFPLLAWLDGHGHLQQQVHDLAVPGESGAGLLDLLDPDRSPPVALDWAAQLVGDRFADNAPDSLRRQDLRDLRVWRRGQPATIRRAVAATLIGTRSVDLRERTYDPQLTGTAPEDPYAFTVVVYAVETPDPDLSRRALAEATRTGDRSVLVVRRGSVYPSSYEATYPLVRPPVPTAYTAAYPDVYQGAA
jgi:hypothetical protein